MADETKTLGSATRNNIGLFYQSIDMPGGYKFDTAETIKKSLAYFDGHFLKGDKDKLGIKKNFFNIIKSTCDVATKFIDLDTKDIMFLSTGGSWEWVWLIQKDFKDWVKNSEFAELLNEIGEHYPRGHVIIKKTKDGWKRVPISNIRVSPNVHSLEQSAFVYEPLSMTKGEIESMSWNQKANIENLFKNHPEEVEFLIYECYDKMAKGWKRQFRADVFTEKSKDNKPRQSAESISANKGQSEELPTLILHEDEIKNISSRYRELKWDEKDGRWLGFGYPEYLFPNQIRRNEVKHLEKITMYLKALIIYLTNDDKIGDNVISNLDMGQIVKTSGRLEQVKRDNVDLSAYELDKKDWDMNTTRKTFDTDIARGDTLPSQTPLGLGELQAFMTSSYFEKKREKFGLFIKRLLYEEIIPSFRKDRKRRHSLMIANDDSEFKKFVKVIANNMLAKKLVEFYNQTGSVPTASEVEAERTRISDELSSRKQIEIDIPERAYETRNIKFTIDILITGESMNVQKKFNAFQTALTTLAQNPQIMANEATRTIFFKLLELQGVPPMEIGLMEEAAVNASEQLLTMSTNAQPNQPAQAKAEPARGTPQGMQAQQL